MLLASKVKKYLRRRFSLFNYSRSFNLRKLNSRIYKLICSTEINTISFDIFDTLLVRQCITPSDIFALIGAKVDKKFNISFYSIRSMAEKELKNRYASIEDIYDFISVTYSLPREITDSLMKEELYVEKTLLKARVDIFNIYLKAKNAGKRIIAVSDMYLSSKYLEEILNENKIYVDKIYVSNEARARKDEGTLFKYVLEKENTENIIHIGDNYIADYRNAKKNGIRAFYYPSVKEIFYSTNGVIRKNIYNLSSYLNENYFRNIYIGFVINYIWNKLNKAGKKIINTDNFIVYLLIAPYVTYIIERILKNKEIQHNYREICFIARDGYLPKKIYDILSQNGEFSKSKYIYGSRRAYWTGIYNSFEDLFFRSYKKVSGNFRFGDFLSAYIPESHVLSEIIKKYTCEELNLSVVYEHDKCLNLISKYGSFFHEEYQRQLLLAKRYYLSSLGESEEKKIIFDVGYSGTVSLGISKLSGKEIDKIYLNQTTLNMIRDYQNNSKTYHIMNGRESLRYSWADLLFEEVFSPSEGSCIGFRESGENIIEVLEDNSYLEKTKKAQKVIEDLCTDFARSYNSVFGSLSSYLYITDINPLFEITRHLLYKKFKIDKILDNLCYPDKVVLSTQVPTSKKLRNNLRKCGYRELR